MEEEEYLASIGGYRVFFQGFMWRGNGPDDERIPNLHDAEIARRILAFETEDHLGHMLGGVRANLQLLHDLRKTPAWDKIADADENEEQQEEATDKPASSSVAKSEEQLSEFWTTFLPLLGVFIFGMFVGSLIVLMSYYEPTPGTYHPHWFDNDPQPWERGRQWY